MLAKLTAKNQLTLPKAAIVEVGASEYFDVEVRDGAIVLTPVRIQRGDAVRARLAELDLDEGDIAAAVDWARRRVAEPHPAYGKRKNVAAPARKPGRTGRGK